MWFINKTYRKNFSKSEKALMELGLTKDDVTDASGKLVDMITLLEKL